MNPTFEFSDLELRIHMILDALSNGESVKVNDDDIVAAGKAFENVIRRRVEEGKRKFKGLRMSNMGKPVCQLQQEQAGTEPARMPYNHAVRMMIGDAVDIFMAFIVKSCGVNVTGERNKASFEVNGTLISGEDDIEIDGAVWDIKSSSPYLYEHKWKDGWDGVYYTDTFGYVEQLFGYAKAQNKKMGGWIVIDKSSGEVKVVKASPTSDQLKHIEEKIKATEQRITNRLTFQKCFEPEVELFRKKPTGNLAVPTVCTFCPFMHSCWPDAMLKPKGMSQATAPKPTWYIEYNEETNLKPINGRIAGIIVGSD